MVFHDDWMGMIDREDLAVVEHYCDTFRGTNRCRCEEGVMVQMKDVGEEGHRLRVYRPVTDEELRELGYVKVEE